MQAETDPFLSKVLLVRVLSKQQTRTRTKGRWKCTVDVPFGSMSHAWFFKNSPLLSPYTRLNSKTDIPHPLCLPMPSSFLWPLLPPYIIKSGVTLVPKCLVALTPLLMQYIKAVLSRIFYLDNSDSGISVDEVTAINITSLRNLVV